MCEQQQTKSFWTERRPASLKWQNCVYSVAQLEHDQTRRISRKLTLWQLNLLGNCADGSVSRIEEMSLSFCYRIVVKPRTLAVVVVVGFVCTVSRAETAAGVTDPVVKLLQWILSVFCAHLKLVLHVPNRNWKTCQKPVERWWSLLPRRCGSIFCYYQLLSVFDDYCTIYTVNHKKRDILFLTITLANLNRFS